MKNNKDTLSEIQKWAKVKKAKVIGVTDNGQHESPGENHIAFHVDTKNWGLEIRPANGWAYVHGYGALEGLSTNISDTSELEAALQRLLKAKGD